MENNIPSSVSIDNVTYDLYYTKNKTNGYKASSITKNIVIFYNNKKNLAKYINGLIQNSNFIKFEQKAIYVFSPIENKFVWIGGKRYQTKFIYKDTKMRMLLDDKENIAYFVLKQNYRNISMEKLNSKLLNLLKIWLFKEVEQRHRNIESKLNVIDTIPINIYKRLSYWGSYKFNTLTKKKEIHYSVLTLLTPREYWDSVMIHEIAHDIFRGKGHSREFKQFCKQNDSNFNIYSRKNNEISAHINLDLEIAK
ncbi:YgjP-like metallopeptidase domain-containing protein [Mycoplasma sp. HS2188]|uniref:YgjP-like metallopeptidase domain-containing protein n=1 Tax=Mycoplasma sp. HS2188 TaxID=2976765 RepID=UPI0021A986D6|nr:YgjP-like metallopeptidase domain-containing protein [Mycoplasma sp. HS2188]MCT4469693.1 DUF45 domain-containing protein [Mycoplasma sp. HS2188]